MAQKNNVPNLNDAGTGYEDYKIRVRKWCRLTKIRAIDQAETLQMKKKKTFWDNKTYPR